jgi:hypothetical protein
MARRAGRANIPIARDTCSHAVPTTQEEAAALIAGLVFTAK